MYPKILIGSERKGLRVGEGEGEGEGEGGEERKEKGGGRDGRGEEEGGEAKRGEEMRSALLNYKELYHRPKKEIRYILLQKSTSFIAVNDLL